MTFLVHLPPAILLTVGTVGFTVACLLIPFLIVGLLAEATLWLEDRVFRRSR